MSAKFMRSKFHLTGWLLALTFSLASVGTVTAAAPVVTVQPQSQQIDLTATIALQVVATGTGPLQYQWQLNGFNIAKATNDTLILSGLAALNIGSYRVKVSNAAGSVYSSTASISLKLFPTTLMDMFANRALTTAMADTRSALIFSATKEPGEPLHDGKIGGHSVWVAWRAPANGIATFSTIGSSFDTVLAVYIGTTITNLQPVAADDDSGGSLTSLVKFNAIAGTEYEIAVDGFFGLIGNCTLNWSLQITNNLLATILATAGNKTVSLGDPVSLFVSLDTQLASVQWYFNGQPIPGAQSTALTIASAQPTNVGSYQAKVTLVGQPVYSPTMSVQIINTDGNGILTTAAYDKFGDLIGALQNPPLPGTPGMLSAKSMHKSAATDSRGYTTTQTFSTTGAAKEPGEPNACGVTGGASMWYAYKAPTNGTLAIDTQGSSFDTVLAVYIGPGTSYSTLTNVDCNNDTDGNNRWSRVGFSAQTGVTYYIQLDGVNGAHGTAYLNITLGNVPGITGQPQSQTGFPGGRVTFQVTATGAPPPNYQWYFNSTPLAAATNSSLVITNFQSSLAGSYYAIVSNWLGTATSQLANLVTGVAAQCNSLKLDHSGLATVHILGTSGQSAILQASTNLILWKSVATNTFSSAAWDYPDTNSRVIPFQFYRVVPGP